jgi:precorrin-6B methylase 2
MLLVFSFLLILAIFLALSIRRQKPVASWKEKLNLDKHFAVYHTLYKDVNGFALSRLERKGTDSFEFTYGEIKFYPFIALLSLCRPDSSTIFYDLGSGTGKAVIACALVFNVQKSCGIEIFPRLHACAQRQQQRLKHFPNYCEKSANIEFKNADFLQSHFKDASIVFVNATAFFGDHWLVMSQHMEQVKPGARVITTSKAVRSNRFQLLKTTQVEMSWGVVRAYIQERLPLE